MWINAYSSRHAKIPIDMHSHGGHDILHQNNIVTTLRPYSTCWTTCSLKSLRKGTLSSRIPDHLGKLRRAPHGNWSAAGMSSMSSLVWGGSPMWNVMDQQADKWTLSGQVKNDVSLQCCSRGYNQNQNWKWFQSKDAVFFRGIPHKYVTSNCWTFICQLMDHSCNSSFHASSTTIWVWSPISLRPQAKIYTDAVGTKLSSSSTQRRLGRPKPTSGQVPPNDQKCDRKQMTQIDRKHPAFHFEELSDIYST
jgi:hypothetical protein